MKLCIIFVLLFASLRFAHPQQCRSVMVCDEDQVRTSKGPKEDAGVAGKARLAGSKGEKGEVGRMDLERLLAPPSCKLSRTNGRQILRNGMEVFCSHGWTVFQKHVSAAVSFDQNWMAYEQGFGDLDGNFWMGLAKLHNLTSNLSCKLRVDLWDSSEVHTFAKYRSFSIGNASDYYRLHVSRYYSRSTAEDWFSYHDNNPFTTKDQDNDRHIGNCANLHNGAGWWYHGGCYHANLNLPFGPLHWYFTYQSSTMKFRCR